MIYLRLFWEFFKTGLFSVGGGLATLPFIYDMSDRTGWFTYQQIADMVAVSESTPGPIGVNTATYVGYITGGVPGALIATLGLVTPAVIAGTDIKSARHTVGRLLHGAISALCMWVLANLLELTRRQTRTRCRRRRTPRCTRSGAAFSSA